MANEKRSRQNNLGGLLGGGMLLTDTSINFGTAPGVVAIGTTAHAAIILDPGNALEEIVYLTAYTPTATTGTILRGQEGTTAIAHSSGAAWAHGPT